VTTGELGWTFYIEILITLLTAARANPISFLKLTLNLYFLFGRRRQRNFSSDSEKFFSRRQVLLCWERPPGGLLGSFGGAFSFDEHYILHGNMNLISYYYMLCPIRGVNISMTGHCTLWHEKIYHCSKHISESAFFLFARRRQSNFSDSKKFFFLYRSEV